MQLHDFEEVDYTVEAVDAKGYSVSGSSFTCTSSDESVVTVKNSGNTFTAVAGQPGNATLTFSDGNLSVTEAIDVIPGDAVKAQVTAGETRPQEGATPPADTPPADAPPADTPPAE